MEPNVLLNTNENIVCQAKMKKPIKLFLIFGLFWSGLSISSLIGILVTVDDPVAYFVMPLFAGTFIAIGAIFVVKYFKDLVISRNISLILTNKRIFIYYKNKYLNFYFAYITSWRHWFPSYINPAYASSITFIFETADKTYKAKGIKNIKEFYAGLLEVIPEKYSEVDKNAKIKPNSLNENENIVCQAKMKKPVKSFLAVGIFFDVLALIILIVFLTISKDPSLFVVVPILLSIFFIIGTVLVIKFFEGLIVSKNISLIITNEGVFVYDKNQSDYSKVYFTDVVSWKCNQSNIAGPKAIFVFKTAKNTYKAKGIANGQNFYNALYRAMPEKYNLKNSISDRLNNPYANSINLLNRNFLLNEKEKIICQAKMEEPIKSFLIAGIIATIIPFAILIVVIITALFLKIKSPILYIVAPCAAIIFMLPGISYIVSYRKTLKLSENISLIVTNERIFIYNNEYLGFYFNDIIKLTMDYFKYESNAGFIIETTNGSYKANGITNKKELYDKLVELMPEKCHLSKRYKLRYHIYENTINKKSK